MSASQIENEVLSFPVDPHQGHGESNPIGEDLGNENDEIVDHDHIEFSPREPGEAKPEGESQHYEPVPVGVEQADPIEHEPTRVGWLEWENDVEAFASRQGGGTINWSLAERKWSASLHSTFAAATSLFTTIKRKLHRLELYTPSTINFKSLWGYGDNVQSAWNTQAGYVDSFNYSLWVTDPRDILLPVDQVQILYDVPLSMSVFGRARTHTNLMAGLPIDAVRSYIGEFNLASSFHQKILTKATRGDTHQAFLTIAFTRLFAIKAAEETGSQSLAYLTSSEAFNSAFIPVKSGDENPKRTIATYVNDYEPSNLITLPLGSSIQDFYTMYYLAGNSRLFTTIAHGNVDKVAYSPFDSFKAGIGFLINPLVGDQLLRPQTGKTNNVQLISSAAEDLLSRYINEHNLWSQASTARAHALLLTTNPRVGITTSLPMPCHFSDFSIGMFANPRAAQDFTRVLAPGEDIIPILATSWMLNLMALDVTCEGVFTCFENNGVSLSSNNFVSQASLRLDELLPEGMSHLALPVIEKLLGDKYPDVNQYISHSPLELAKHLAANYDERPIRFSSYLYLEDEAEEEGMKLVFSESARTQLWQRKDCTLRERVIASYLAYDQVVGYNEQMLRLDYYNLDPTTDRTHIIPDQSYNKNQLQFLKGKPKAQDVTCFFHHVAFTTGVSDSWKASLSNLHLEHKSEIASWAGLSEQFEAALASSRDWCDDDSDSEDDGPRPSKNARAKGKEKVIAASRPTIQEPPSRGSGHASGASASGAKTVDSNASKPKNTGAGGGWEVPRKTCRTRPGGSGRRAAQAIEFAGNPFEVLATRPGSSGLQEPEVPDFAGNPFEGLPDVGPDDSISHIGSGVEVPIDWEDYTLDVNDISIVGRRTRNSSTGRKFKVKNEPTEDQYLNQTIQQNKDALSNLLNRSNPSEMDVKLVDGYFPRGKDDQLKRAMYTVGSLTKNVKQITSDTRKIKLWRQFLVNGIGGKNAWAVTVSLFILGNTLTQEAENYLIEVGLLKTTYDEWNSKWSSFNDIIRNSWASGNWQFSSDDFVQCLYMSNAVGRPHREVDWDDEIRKRSQPGKEIHIIERSGTREATKQELRQMLWDTLEAEATYKPTFSSSFRDFYKKRANWMIRGSMAGERNVAKEDKAVWLDLQSEGLGIRTNTTKTDVAEWVTADDLEKVLENPPIHLARAHTKGNENGKIRAIYGSLYSHYVFGSYWSYHYEDRLSFKSASLNKSNSTLICEAEERAKACEEGKVITCLDYPDFNSSHSCQLQRLVIEVISNWCQSKGLKPHKDLTDITSWYAKSFENQYFRVPTTGEWHKAESTMFSGVRQTTIINTLINLTYHRHYLKMSHLLGSPLQVHHAFVLGDDGWVAFQTMEDARTYVSIAEHCKMSLNPIKQLTSQGRGEYLRLIYDKDGHIRGCPVRSLSSAVHGNVESNKPSVATQRVTEFYSQWAMLARRGLDRGFAQRVFENLSFYEVDKDNRVGKQTVLRLLYGTKKSTGLGLYPIKEMPDLRDEQTKSIELDPMALASEERSAAEVLNKHNKSKQFKASGDFVSWIESKYGVVWKHLGKTQAVNLFAAANLLEGGAKSTVQHQAALYAATQSIFSRSQWAESQRQAKERKPTQITAEQVEKDYREIRATEDRMTAMVADIGKLVRFMSEDSVQNMKQILSRELGIGLAGIEKALNSMRNSRPDKVDYVPTPHLVPELESLYTMWLVVQPDPTNVLTIPNWLYPASKRMRY